MTEFRNRISLFSGTIMLAFVGLLLGERAWLTVLHRTLKDHKDGTPTN